MVIPERVRIRFWDKVDMSGGPDACWPFLLSVGSHGYGQIGWQGEDGRTVMKLAHRIAWEMGVGSIPEALTIDHICRNRVCCNPTHLRLLTNIENASDNVTAHAFSSRTHCEMGHELTESNIYWSGPDRRWRTCRTCKNANQRRRYAERKAAV